MATNVTVRFAGDTTRLKKATKESQTILGKFQKTAQGALSGAGLAGMAGMAKGGAYAAAAAAIVSQVSEATKAYYEDAKAQAVLNAQIVNVTDASAGQLKAIDDQIQSLSLMAAVSDDALRPAMALLTQQTGDTEEAMRLLTLATNISAGTGKDLQSVSMALGKAFNGNTTSLKKLGVNIQDTSRWTEELENRYSGLAKTAAENDPLGRMAIQMEQVQEQVGAAFAPMVEQFASFLSSDSGKQILDMLVKFTQISFKPLEMLMPILSAVFTLLTPLMKVIEIVFALIEKGVQYVADFFKGWGKIDWLKNALTGLMVPINIMMNGLDTILKLLGQADDAVKEYGPSTADVVADAMERKNKDIADKAAKARKARLAKASDLAAQAAKETAARLKDAASSLMESGKNFKDSLDFAFGMNDDKTFSVAKFMEQTKKIVKAAKELPAKLKALRKQGASDEVISNILAQGPEAANAIATGFLKEGGVKQYAAALQSLDTSGRQAAGVAMGNKSYSININKANMTAEEIIKVIQAYEKKTGTKVVFGG